MAQQSLIQKATGQYSLPNVLNSLSSLFKPAPKPIPKSGIGYINGVPAASMVQPGSFNLSASPVVAKPKTVTPPKVNPTIKPAPAPVTVTHPVVQGLMENDPRFAKNIMAMYESNDPSMDAIINSLTTGDYSGMPWTPDVANSELEKQMKVLDPYFQQERENATGNTSRDLENQQLDYQNYLDTAASDFAGDKSTQDENAAQNGVLFSSGRVAKLNKLQDAYTQDSLFKNKKVANNIGTIASDFQYKYGNDATKNLSSYFGLGNQSYNPFVARGGTTKTPVSTVYNPSSNNFYGTQKALQKTQAIQRASGVLANKGNKLMPNSYAWQY